MIEGGIADDRVIDAVEAYINGYADVERTLRLLVYHQPNVQICILNQEIADRYLHYQSYERTKVMLDFLLWNKIARIIMQLAETLHISNDRALQIFYDSDVCRMLHDKDLGLHLMSDTYIVNDLIEELRNKQ